MTLSAVLNNEQKDEQTMSETTTTTVRTRKLSATALEKCLRDYERAHDSVISALPIEQVFKDMSAVYAASDAWTRRIIQACHRAGSVASYYDADTATRDFYRHTRNFVQHVRDASNK